MDDAQASLRLPVRALAAAMDYAEIADCDTGEIVMHALAFKYGYTVRKIRRERLPVDQHEEG